MKQLSEYPKPKKGVQNNYAKEISKKTGTREDAVDRWLSTNEIDPLTILQGIGSGRINRMDFVSALMSDEATLEFLQQYNSDGKWKSVWGAKPTTESLSEMVRRIIKEEIGELYYISYSSKSGKHGEAGTFRDFKTALAAAVKKTKDEQFMENVEFIGVEGSYDATKFAVLYATNTYISKHLSKDDFTYPEYYPIFLAACKKYISTGKPQLGTFEK